MVAITSAVVAAGVAAKSVSDAKKDASKGRKQQGLENAASRAALEKGQRNARADVERLMPEAQVLRGLGAQSAIDIFSSSMPRQFDAFQQGNVGAQEMILGGMQQQQNAILGLPVDHSSFQPSQMESDFSWLPKQLPQGIIESIMQGYGGNPEEQGINYGGTGDLMMGGNRAAMAGYSKYMQNKLGAEGGDIVSNRERVEQQLQGQHPNQQPGISGALANTIPFMPIGG